MQVDGEAQEEVDKRSVYVGNVDYSATPTDISNHFASSGQINRVTIVCDKFSGHPKGFCYIEFADPATVQNALLLNESMLCGRIITVVAKRTNIPGFNRGGRGRGRAGYRGGFARGGYGYSPYSRPRGRGRGAWRGAA
ncbi:RNA-binding domain-containing protein [Calocera viscosa TUFC12733]|uniref:RNA-binding domain-containing protein n=1 Tax=Calocera viscosa (strain TUFC12733) TaxID=1330018 RepID=A0A167J3F5_CALVF|nr:RNA-binding domain-containing protein [Calocera viscosa TUFC12733]